MAGHDELVRELHEGQQFERARLNDDRPGSVGWCSFLVHHSALHAVSRQLGGHRKAGRTGTYYENGVEHGDPPVFYDISKICDRAPAAPIREVSTSGIRAIRRPGAGVPVIEVLGFQQHRFQVQLTLELAEDIVVNGATLAEMEQ